jgi:type II secretory pathway component PulM
MARQTNPNAPVVGGGLRGAVEAQLESMTPRDRKLLTGLIAFVCLVAVLITAFSLRSSLADRAARVRASKDNLELIQMMADEYTVAAATIEKAEARLAQYENQPTSSFIEKTARDTGVQEQLTAVNEQGSEVTGTLRATSYRVELKKVSLQAATEFIHALETSGYPLSVELARFKTVTVSGDRQLDVTLELKSFQVEKG